MHSWHIRPSVRSTSAMIASCEPDATACLMFAALPPLPAFAVPAAQSARATAASLFMFFMVCSFRPRWGLVRRAVRVVRTSEVVHAHVGREDELVELGRGELGV